MGFSWDRLAYPGAPPLIKCDWMMVKALLKSRAALTRTSAFEVFVLGTLVLRVRRLQSLVISAVNASGLFCKHMQRRKGVGDQSGRQWYMVIAVFRMLEKGAFVE